MFASARWFGGVSLAVVVGVVLAGCSRQYDKGPGGSVTVSGTVKVEGKPVPKGVVSFKPTDGKNFLDGPSGSGGITDGSYTVPGMFPGKYFAVVYLPVEQVEQPKDPYDIPDSRSYTIDIDLKAKAHR
jgi:hypothetical protein